MQTVELTTPIPHAGSFLQTVDFREPRLEEYFEIGDPRAPVLRGEKTYMIPMPEVVKLYVDRLLVDVKPNVIAGASLLDAMKFQKAILQFFREAEAGLDENEPVAGFVKLKKPLSAPQGLVDSFQFREPKIEDFFLLGDPRVQVTASEDRFFLLPVPSVVRVYAERLIIGDAAGHMLAAASLRDAKNVEKAILGFFEVADLAMTSGASPAILRS